MRISFDPDLTFRLAKAGKIYYNKKAIVYHYHRASWRAVLKQQYLIGVVTPQLYIRHPSKATGANISKLSMIVQPVFFYIALLSMLFSLFLNQLMFLAVFLLTLIVFFWLYDTVRLRKNSKRLSPFLFLGYFFVRFIGWIIGLPVGVVRLFKLYFK
jgi:GT2 family glycosyltransferase